MPFFPNFCSCLAGESVHFYDEVQQLDKIPVNDPVRRIYMARHVIEKYIIPGIIFTCQLLKYIYFVNTFEIFCIGH